jgi:hypothetical protein
MGRVWTIWTLIGELEDRGSKIQTPMLTLLLLVTRVYAQVQQARTVL